MVPNGANNAANNSLAQAQIQAHPILLAHGCNRLIRNYAWPNLYDFSLCIMRSTFQGSRFEMNPIMLQMLQTTRQFGGAPNEDPHFQLKSFIIPNITVEEIRLTIVPFLSKR